MNFSSQGKQLCIDDFKSSLEGLNKSNRWVQLGDTLPWYEIEKLYNKVIKRKKKSKSLINKGKSHLLTYLVRDIRSFIDLIAINGSQLFDSLKRNEKKIAGAILKMYHQQEQMFKEDSHTCANRIISIFQSHVRPIVRGKSKSPTEFGAKIGASIVQGYTFVDHHSWDAYNESSDLSVQIELYRERFGFLPAKIYADKIYMNKENRKWMKELEIQAMGKPLGRPPKEAQTVTTIPEICLLWSFEWMINSADPI